MNLQDFFSRHPRAALAFSGGVDSAYLLYAAVSAGIQVKAYYVRTAFQPDFEYQDALRLAGELGAEMEVLPLDILCAEEIAANPGNRCYFCKKRIFSTILRAAARDGYDTLLDGTNASDSAADRPGMRALEELSVLSPLRLCGLSKAEIRRLSKEAELFTHDKPAYACLATRISTGIRITPELLNRTEHCENYLMQLGFSGFRIRLLGDCARIQVPKQQLPRLLELREPILSELKKHYSGVMLDLEVRDNG